MATDTLPSAVSTTAELKVEMNLPVGDIHFRGREGLAKFAQVASERVSCMLELMSNQVDDGMMAVALE